MKRLLLLLTISAFTFACNSNKPNGRLAPDSTLSINVRNSLRADTDDSHKSDWTEEDRIDPKWQELAKTQHLTPNQIVGLAGVITRIYEGISGTRGFIPQHRDYVNNKLLMWATDIIDQDGNLSPRFIDATDVIIRLTTGDTIAYIPNHVLRSAAIQIRENYKKGDYTKVYELFNTAYTAIPVTANEYEALKAQGKN